VQLDQQDHKEVLAQLAPRVYKEVQAAQDQPAPQAPLELLGQLEAQDRKVPLE
jgi:hypothetical protein